MRTSNAKEGPADPGGRDDGRHRPLVESIFDYAIYRLDASGRVASWNPGARRFLGYEALEAIGKRYSTFFPREARAVGLPRQALQTAASQGRYEAEGWRIRSDGRQFWAHAVINPIRDAAGAVAGFVEVARDLTENRQSQEALRQSEERFRLLVQSVADYAIYMLDPEGRITNWNLGGERLKGYAPDEIVGQHFSKFYTEEDRAAGLPAHGLEIAAREGRFEKEGLRVRKDGSRFWANVVIDAIRDRDGKLIGFAKVTRDITERKEAERRLAEAREALFQSQKLEAIGRLTGGVAHDFNNLLTVVVGSLELLEKRLPADPKAARLLRNAVEGAQRGVALTQRMLAFARKQELDPRPVDVPSLVRGMADLMQRSLGAAMTVELRFPPTLPPAVVDSNQLELALLNLLTNARDATPAGGPVTVTAREERLATGADGLAAGRYVCLSVIDCGSGMDPATLERASEPFFTTKGVGKGTGLGLSMVHGLAQQSNGALILKSVLGKGTTAEIWLPVGEPLAALASPIDFAERKMPMGKTILAVDDDHLVLMNTVAMLEEIGHRALSASSGREALELLQQNPDVELMLTDVVMPQMTGIELVRQARAERPALKVLLATGYAELLTEEGQRLPRVTKPFRLADLARAIDGALAAGPS